MRTIFTLTILLCTTLSSLAQEQDIAKLEKLLPGIGARDLAERQAAQSNWTKVCNSIQKPVKPYKAALCTAMSEMLLRDRTKLPAKVFICRQLERLADAESVAALTELLGSDQAGAREAARRALANNPSSKAGLALIDRYAKVDKLQEQRALIHALGFRGEAESINLLSTIAESANGPLLISAVAALSNVATSNKVPTKLLRKGYDKDGLLRLADRLAAEGKIKAALAIYVPITKNQPDSGFGAAAFRGLLQHDSEQSATRLTEALAGENKLRRQIATGHLRTVSDSVAEQLMSQFETLPASGQVSLLRALGARSSSSLVKNAVKATHSEDEAVRLAAVEALGPLGAADELIKLLQSENSTLAETAKQTLGRMSAKSVDTALLDFASKHESNADLSKTTMDLLNQRRVVQAVPLFVKSLNSSDANTRQRAVAAISRLGSVSDVAPLLKSLLTQDGSERDRTEKQVVSMCRRLDASPVVEFYETSDSVAQKRLMPLLGRIGDKASLGTIRKRLRSSNSDEVDAAIAALANWPTNEVASDLKKLAQASKTNGQKVRVLRALARVAVLGGSDAEKLTHLEFVFDSATRADEKTLSLERAKAIRTVESLNFVLPHIADAKLGERAQRTVIDLAHHRGLREPNRDAFEPALNAVLKLLKDPKQIERAKKYLANE